MCLVAFAGFLRCDELIKLKCKDVSFNKSCIPKSRRTSRKENDTFIVQDLNRSTEIQYPLLRHLITFSTIAMKR